MIQSADAVERSLALLNAVVPYQYAQWVVEDPESYDYRVTASVIPDGEEGYDIAHRTGVIGQVFRVEKPILVPDTRNHPLYDPFDNTIEWELTFPVFVGERMAAVINLEGTGSLDTGGDVWRRVCEVVQETTQCRVPSCAPHADSSCLINTRRLVIRADREDSQSSHIVEVARAIARGGESTLLVGHFPGLLRDRGPTLAEANQQSLGTSYCYFGVERRLDLLATGPTSQDELLHNRRDWWDTSKGRYAFVLVNCVGCQHTFTLTCLDD